MKKRAKRHQELVKREQELKHYVLQKNPYALVLKRAKRRRQLYLICSDPVYKSKTLYIFDFIVKCMWFKCEQFKGDL